MVNDRVVGSSGDSRKVGGWKGGQGSGKETFLLSEKKLSILSLITPNQTHFKAPLRRRNDTFFVELRC